jgi:hypothetical protein
MGHDVFISHSTGDSGAHHTGNAGEKASPSLLKFPGNCHYGNYKNGLQTAIWSTDLSGDGRAKEAGEKQRCV